MPCRPDPSDDLADLVPEHAMGTLDAATAKRVEAALAGSAELRRALEVTREALATLAVGLSPVAPRPEVRARLLASVGASARFAPFLAELGRWLALPLDAVHAVLGKIDDAAGWAALAPGISVFRFAPGASVSAADPSAEATLLRLAPGTRFPRHSHVGHERALVLAGAGHDGGRVYGPGEIIEYAPGTSHEFHAGQDRDLVLVVVHHGIRVERA